MNCLGYRCVTFTTELIISVYTSMIPERAALPPPCAVLGDPKGGSQININGAALRALFFIPSALPERAWNFVGAALTRSSSFVKFASLLYPPGIKTLPAKPGAPMLLNCGELATTFEPFYFRFTENQRLEKHWKRMIFCPYSRKRRFLYCCPILYLYRVCKKVKP